MSDYFALDPAEALGRKMDQNETKYPADAFHGRHNYKYDRLGTYHQPADSTLKNAKPSTTSDK